MKKMSCFGLFVLLLFSCTKYPDGPNGSLLTKKSRVAGVWDLQESLTITGEVLGNQDDYLITMKKNSSLSIETPVGTISGNWILTNEGKTLKLAYNSTGEEFIIRRLKKKELWLQRQSDGLILKYKNTDK